MYIADVVCTGQLSRDWGQKNREPHREGCYSLKHSCDWVRNSTSRSVVPPINGLTVRRSPFQSLSAVVCLTRVMAISWLYVWHHFARRRSKLLRVRLLFDGTEVPFAREGILNCFVMSPIKGSRVMFIQCLQPGHLDFITVHSNFQCFILCIVCVPGCRQVSVVSKFDQY